MREAIWILSAAFGNVIFGLTFEWIVHDGGGGQSIVSRAAAYSAFAVVSTCICRMITRRMYTNLESRYHAQQGVLNGLSHDIRGPLQAAIFACEILRKDLDTLVLSPNFGQETQQSSFVSTTRNHAQAQMEQEQHHTVEKPNEVAAAAAFGVPSGVVSETIAPTQHII